MTSYTDEQIKHAAERLSHMADPVRHLGDETGWLGDDASKMLHQLLADRARLQAEVDALRKIDADARRFQAQFDDGDEE